MLYFWGIALDRLILDVSLNLDHGHFDPYTANPRVLIEIALVYHFWSLFRLRCHSGSSAASQDSLFFIASVSLRWLLLCCCLAKSTFTVGLLT